MANWLALTWENDRLLLLSANVHNGSATFEHCAVFATPQADKSAEDTGEAAQPLSRAEQGPSIKQQLADYLQKNRLSKTETVVVLSRADVEVRSMVFPPVPVEELPDLVRFQATKEFNGYDATAPLDFFITTKLDNVSRSTLFPALQPGKGGKGQNAPAGAPKHLIASTIRSARFQKIQQQCEQWNLPLKHLLLRPCQSAYLWRHTPRFDPGQSVLFVELDANETSQVVLFQGEPIFMRTPKISCPDDVSASDFAARLIAELKRTRIAVRNEIQGVTIDEVVLCGVGKGFETLAKQVSDSMGVTVTQFDPWVGLSRGGELRVGRSEAMVEKPERFAPLLGSLLQIAKGETSEIDFCNPTKRPEPVGKRQLATGIIAATFLFILALGGFGLYAQSVLDKDVKELGNRRTALNRQAATFREQRAQLTAIEAWQADKVNWFEQLDWLARSVPESKDMMISKMTLNAANGGSMSLETLLRDSSVMTSMDKKLNDGQLHILKTGEQREDRSTPPYTYRYHFSVHLSKDAAAQPPTEIEHEPEPPEGEQPPADPAGNPENGETAGEGGVA